MVVGHLITIIIIIINIIIITITTRLIMRAAVAGWLAHLFARSSKRASCVLLIMKLPYSSDTLLTASA